MPGILHIQSELLTKIYKYVILKYINKLQLPVIPLRIQGTYLKCHLFKEERVGLICVQNSYLVAYQKTQQGME